MNRLLPDPDIKALATLNQERTRVRTLGL